MPKQPTSSGTPIATTKHTKPVRKPKTRPAPKGRPATFSTSVYQV